MFATSPPTGSGKQLARLWLEPPETVAFELCIRYYFKSVSGGADDLRDYLKCVSVEF